MTAPLLLTQHRATLVSLIRANEAAHADRAGRFILDGISARAERLIERIDFLIAHPAQFEAGLWGENGKAPMIRALVREGERQRGFAASERRAAA
jgi:hypothetical protein